MKKAIDEWEVLTPDGWSTFSGIKETTRDAVYEIQTTTGTSLVCSSEHKIKTHEGKFVPASSIVVGTEIESNPNQKVSSVLVRSEVQTKLYDLLDVEKNNQYYTNGLVSHNCAHIDNLEELWLGLYPTLSTGGRAIVFSTPAGKNFFYQMWMGAETGEWEEGKVGQHCKGVGKNGFHGIKLPWHVHPERDDAWFEDQAKPLDARGIAQELLCSFEGSSLTFFSQNDIDFVRSLTVPPIGYAGPNGKGQDLHIWKTSIPDHQYVLAADVARGDADDYSTFHVFDTNESEVVAEYMGKIPPDRFGEFIIEIGKRYNNALIVNEKNTVGLVTAIKLRDAEYPSLYYDPDVAEKMLGMLPDERKEVYPGFTVSGKNREKILENLEQVIRNHQLKIYSLRFVSQMETFIWNGKRGQALKKRHDDLIMAMAIGLQMFTPLAAQQGYLGMQAANQSLAMAMLAGMRRGYRDVKSKVDGKRIPAGVNPETIKNEVQFRKEFWWVY